MGAGLPFVDVEVKEGSTSEARLAILSYPQAALSLCHGGAAEAQTVIVGHVLGPDQQALGNVPLELSWQPQSGIDVARARTIRARTGSDGRFVVCKVPGEVRLTVRAEVNGRWIDVFEVVPRLHEITYRNVWVTR